MSKHRTHKIWWNRLLSGVLCLALALGLLPTAGLIQTADAHWADPYGEQLVEWGVMNSASDLRLDDPIKRSEFVAMCNRAFGYSKLGDMPFVDVPSSAWYAQDINIAYNAGYFQGTSTDPANPTASPNGKLTREQAAVLIARNMMLQETVGESLGFTDSRDLSEWSRGLIGAAVAENMITGYTDGSFRPFNYITRGEVAAMLVRILGTPVSKPGSYELDDVYGNITISSSDVTLRNTVILGNLYITGGVDLGNVLLENVTVLGRIVISGGGVSNAAQSSVILRNVTADEMVVDSLTDQFVTISAYGLTDIPNTYVRSDAYLEDSCAAGYGLHHIVQDGASLLRLAGGTIKDVLNRTPESTLQLVRGTAEVITIDEYATNSELLIDINTRVDDLNLDVATLVYGEGDIINLHIGADGCEVEIIPEHVDITPGLTASLGKGENQRDIGSAAASELSSEPRLLAGYPAASNLTPTAADGLYAGNKRGTIYWAVSAIADGSVTPENLLNPPPYGGKIHQNGTIDASRAKAEYLREISNLEPDGSYYISAILVDERGKQSPLKVVSFTTPDDTVPAFVEGYPYMSLVTCETAQVTAMANKSCQLYWVLLPVGAAAPTPQQFRSASFGGRYGYGSQSVVKNVPVSIKVNSATLQENTGYELYLWLNDFDGTYSSQVYHVPNDSTHPSFTTPDETAPVITGPVQTDSGEKDAQVMFSISEAGATLYWAVVADSNESFIPAGSNMESLQIQLKVKSGASAIVSGSKLAEGENMDTYIQPADFKSALDYKTYGTHSFKFYCVAEDAAGNFSEVKLITIRTLDTDPPHAWLEYSDAKNDSPRADSDISIVFDEEVQGGTSAENTFLALYERVETYTKLGSGYTQELNTAKNALAKELDAHFQLWSTPRSGSAERLEARTSVSSTSTTWKIDWTQATVTKDAGKLIITVPNSALKLDSGATYQFRLYGVYDLAQTPNAMAVGSDGVTCVPEGGTASASNASSVSNSLPRLEFTTVYAQVELYDRAGETKIESTDTAINGIRLDMAFDVVPKSTSKVPSTEFWDMIIWSNTTVSFDVYCKKMNSDGTAITGEDWVKIVDGNGFEMSLGTNSRAISLSARRQSTLDPDFVCETVVSGLDEKYIYRYGIHFTAVGGVSESEGLDNDQKDNAAKLEPVAWGVENLTLSISLVAGNESTIKRRIAIIGDVDGAYTECLASGELSEIGDVDGNGVESILQCHSTFTDTKVPSFTGSFPEIDTSSNAVTIDVALDRKGTVFYVIAPASGSGGWIPTQITKNDGTVTNITSANDGTNGGPDGKSYIPTGGSDITGNESKIQFVADDENSKPLKYTSPLASAIVNGSYTGRITGSIDYDSETVTIREGNLESDTWYYVYMVLQGGGDYDDIVQIYRFKTDPPSPPIITISASSLTASMTTYDGADLTSSNTSRQRIDAELTYALVSWSNLPDFFKYEFTYTKNGDSYDTSDSATYTLLEMLIERVPGASISKTLFDEYADTAYRVTTSTSTSGTTKTVSTTETAASYKSRLMDYIENGGTYTGTQRPLAFDDGVCPATGDPLRVNYAEDTSLNLGDNFEVEYGVLVYGRTVGAGDGNEHYAFAAAQGMYQPDPVPPVFVHQTPETVTGTREVSYVRLTTNLKAHLDGATAVDTQWQNRVKTTPSNIFRYTFDGDITITFTKPLYQYITLEDNSTVRRPVLAGKLKTGETSYQDNTEGVHILNAITAPDNVTLTVTGGTTSGAQSTFNIHFEGLAYGGTLTILGGGRITNSSPTGQVSDYQLRLVFNPLLPESAFGQTFLEDLYVGGFEATWSKP